MGQKTKRHSRHQPDEISHGLDSSNTQNGGSGGVSEEQQELPEVDFLDVSLVEVNAQTLGTTDVGDSVRVQGHQVHVRKGRLGNIPHARREQIAGGGYERGTVLNTDAVMVRLVK